MTVSDHSNNPCGTQWQRYWDDALYPALVREVPHVAREVDDLEAELEITIVILEPNSHSPALKVALIEVNGAPMDLME